MKETFMVAGAELEPSTAKSIISTSKSVLNTLKKAHNLYVKYRVTQFLSTLEDEIENLSIERQKEINEFLNNKKSQKVLADYAAAITSTSSDIAIRALALLLIDDRQFSFTENEKARFISCIRGMDDLKVNLFIKLSELKCIDLETVFPIYLINNINHPELELGVDIDELFAYAEDFINRGLLLRDPRSETGSSFYSPAAGDWSICFGISATLKKYASFLRKAKYLTQNKQCQTLQKRR
ncbi:hypothetical protein FJQ87_00340 [Shewanella sp. SNU WT4]|uniref:hypothetical protein n=1 Tax=Shewanella sp. SNU WT4 TaxID=2590015 RepID=UPI00112B1D52|nr:hypothetical protein [Shewanella sp. SNU WT4]QDF65331.1 hypothetical protein FJQ87_00340 [Shewanella sp. SNU WT4]